MHCASFMFDPMDGVRSTEYIIYSTLLLDEHSLVGYPLILATKSNQDIETDLGRLREKGSGKDRPKLKVPKLHVWSILPMKSLSFGYNIVYLYELLRRKHETLNVELSYLIPRSSGTTHATPTRVYGVFIEILGMTTRGAGGVAVRFRDVGSLLPGYGVPISADAVVVSWRRRAILKG